MLIEDSLRATAISEAETRQRVATLHSMAVLDTPPEAAFDALARAAASVCETPMAVISLIDGPRVWFKAVHGIDIRGGDSSGSFCLETANRKQALEVCNTSHDARFATGPWAGGGFGLQYYAGAPIMYAGVAIGTICAADFVPGLVQRLRACRDTLLPQLLALPGVEVAVPDGGLYAFFRVAGQGDSLAFAKRLVAEAGLGLAPGVAFGAEGEGWLRWCFASHDPARLTLGTQRLAAFLKL